MTDDLHAHPARLPGRARPDRAAHQAHAAADVAAALRAHGFDVRLKAELFQRVGSYKIRGPLNKFALMPDEQKRRGVVCSSAGNHAQGVALAAQIHGIRAVVCMAANATPSKIAATRGYGAEVVLHGSIWDEANEKAKELVRNEGLTYVHPFDDEQLIAGQGTLGLEVVQDWPEVDAIVVPIGGGGLISGVVDGGQEPQSVGARHRRRVVATGRRCSAASRRGARRPSTAAPSSTACASAVSARSTSRSCSDSSTRSSTLPDREIFDAMIWVMERCKLVVEGAAAAPVAALLHGLVKLPPGSRVAAVLSGGNLNLDQLRALTWN